MKDKKEKKVVVKNNKPSSTADFDAMAPVIVDGKLVVIDPKIKLVFWRRRSDGDIYSFAYIEKTYPDGTVTLWDDTLEQRFLFNLNTDIKMVDHLRVYDKNAKKKAITDDGHGPICHSISSELELTKAMNEEDLSAKAQAQLDHDIMQDIAAAQEALAQPEAQEELMKLRRVHLIEDCDLCGFSKEEGHVCDQESVG